MVEAVTSVFRNYANFSGRARRAEYWWYTLALAILGFVYGVISGVADGSGASGLANVLTILFGLVYLAIIVPTIAVTVRRLHDTGKSGFFWFIGLIPFVGGIILIVFCAQDSVPGPNQYGPNPKGVGDGYGQFPGQPPQFGPNQYGQPGQYGQQPGQF
ncbi:DUF805 domain-containing protein [Kineococcus sp. DHX-1]|uniref:DUF805 domain-containing protein n=1 Tax=Kineococcus sp. DHX-1 TaxID=3349638 RepID=UPI0036D22F5C